MTKNLAASVRARLLAEAKSRGTDFNQVLVLFALERLLYRLSQSAHAERFLLKGALLFALWYDMPHRPTRDADLLGMTNTRLKDYFDLWVLLNRESFDIDILTKAIAATFASRGMTVPSALPIGLSDEFATDPSRQALWRAFIKKNDLTADLALADVVMALRKALLPALIQASV